MDMKVLFTKKHALALSISTALLTTTSFTTVAAEQEIEVERI